MSPCYKHMRPLPTHNFVHNKQGHFCLIIFQMRMQQAWRFSKPEKWGFHSNSVQRSKVVIDHYKRWPGPLSTSRPQIIVKLASGYNAVQMSVLWSIHFSIPGSMVNAWLAVSCIFHWQFYLNNCYNFAAKAGYFAEIIQPLFIYFIFKNRFFMQDKATTPCQNFWSYAVRRLQRRQCVVNTNSGVIGPEQMGINYTVLLHC